MTIHKERVLNRNINRHIYNHLSEQGPCSRAELRKTFVRFGVNSVSRALNELTFFDLISENKETHVLEAVQ